MFDTEEMDLLLNIAKSDQQIEQPAQERLDLSATAAKTLVYLNARPCSNMSHNMKAGDMHLDARARRER